MIASSVMVIADLAILAAEVISLLISSASRADSGTYKIQAGNDCGQTEKEVSVLVVGKMFVPQYIHLPSANCQCLL